MCHTRHMATNLKIDPHLLDEAKRIGQFRTKKDAVNQALTEFIQQRKQTAILDWEGKVDFFDDYDYKSLRASSPTQYGHLGR